VSSRLVELTARRVALQAECALRRDDAAQSLAEIEHGVARIDRAVAAARRFAPLLVVGGAVALIAVGPSRALSMVARGLALGLYAKQARRLLG